MRRLVVIPAAVAATLALGVGTASANSYTADATCDGVALSLPRAEDGTVVRTYRNGALVRTDTVTTFGAPVAFTVASPDRTVAQAWRIEVDSRWNADQVFAETVPACVAPSTTASPTTTTTVAPATTTTTVPTVAVTTPPVPTSTTVVQPPRTPSTTVAPSVPPVAPPVMLPATGQAVMIPLFLALAASAAGLFLMLVRRRGGAS